MLYRVQLPISRTRTVIDTDYTCSCKSNYHTITATTARSSHSWILYIILTCRSWTHFQVPLCALYLQEWLYYWNVKMKMKNVVLKFFYYFKIHKNIRYQQIRLFLHGSSLLSFSSSNVLIHFSFINTHLAITLQTTKWPPLITCYWQLVYCCIFIVIIWWEIC